MSDTAPDRTVGAPPPRVRTPEPDLTRMMASRREQPATEQQAVEPPVEQPKEVAQPRQKESAAPTRAPASRTPVSQAADGPITKNTTYLSDATRNRARAAYRATSLLEDDHSWSDFVEKAIAAEATRREEIYNDAQPYVSDGVRLRAGRPLG